MMELIGQLNKRLKKRPNIYNIELLEKFYKLLDN